MPKKAALLVFACDRYELLYRGFEYTFKKNWPLSDDFNYYFSTEEKELEMQDFIHLKSGNGPWTNRLKKVLNQIEEKYILFFQEDMWLDQKVDTAIADQLLEYVIANNIQLVKLHSSEVYTTRSTGKSFGGLVLAEVDKANSQFLMSHQVSIWKKDFLINQLKDNEHPWRNERRGSKRLAKSNSVIYQMDLLAENGKPPINENDSTEGRGAYYTVSVNATLHDKAKPIIEEIKAHLPEYGTKLEYHCENKITHDGLSQPRKIDIFKKIKNSLKGK